MYRFFFDKNKTYGFKFRFPVLLLSLLIGEFIAIKQMLTTGHSNDLLTDLAVTFAILNVAYDYFVKFVITFFENIIKKIIK